MTALEADQGDLIFWDSAGSGGGALYFNAKIVSLPAKTITGNKAAYGAAGLYSYGASVVASGVIISSNTALADGYGVYLYFGSAVFIGCILRVLFALRMSPFSAPATKINLIRISIRFYLYSFSVEPADLSGFCADCPIGQYARCGSMSCSTNEMNCSATQVYICNNDRRALMSASSLISTSPTLVPRRAFSPCSQGR